MLTDLQMRSFEATIQAIEAIEAMQAQGVLSDAHMPIFWAMVQQYIPLLIAEVRGLKAEVEALQAERERWSKCSTRLLETCMAQQKDARDAEVILNLLRGLPQAALYDALLAAMKGDDDGTNCP